ncbi:hypothetical protein B0T16DRAFT_235338 [Cercophora newfieldiana]|uniref:Uncharacterized protein n=1 Tax=Cercophora newfieldiana TaxID=92897 RepID=A0AA39XRN8_9PEZI|nr:hypothetical protein B0T16DRAFT_235338 [Cercophora newfieldiana]
MQRKRALLAPSCKPPLHRNANTVQARGFCNGNHGSEAFAPSLSHSTCWGLVWPSVRLGPASRVRRRVGMERMKGVVYSRSAELSGRLELPDLGSAGQFANGPKEHAPCRSPISKVLLSPGCASARCVLLLDDAGPLTPQRKMPKIPRWRMSRHVAERRWLEVNLIHNQKRGTFTHVQLRWAMSDLFEDKKIPLTLLSKGIAQRNTINSCKNLNLNQRSTTSPQMSAA